MTTRRLRVFFEMTRPPAVLEHPELRLVGPGADSVLFLSHCCASGGRSRELYPDTCDLGPSLAVFEGVPAGGSWKLYGSMLIGSASIDRFALFIEE